MIGGMGWPEAIFYSIFTIMAASVFIAAINRRRDDDE